MSPLPGVDSNIESNRKQLLDAIARAGSAGEKEYNDAKAQITSYRQQVIDNAAKGASGSAELAAQLQTQSGTPFDRRLSDNASASADFSAGLARSQSAHDSYLTNVSAAQGTLQANNANKLNEREFQLKAITAQLEAKAQQDAADREADRLEKEEDRQMRRETHAIALQKAQAASAPKPPKPPKFDDLFGQARALDERGPVGVDGTRAQMLNNLPLTDHILMSAQDNYAYKKNMGQQTSPEIELARLVGEAYGLNPGEVNTIMTPEKLKNYYMSDAPENPVAKSLATKYASKGVDYNLAQSVVNNVDYQEAVRWILGGAEGKDRAEVENIIRQNFITRDNRNWTAEYNILVGDWLPLVPKEVE